ncbi:HIRAN domain-containing protein [Arcicella sp. LKC2W]|uniref:HIRAN domain-containing protein n=1 Tax=Arcicella sp. LKC2W TaxID=2984198 RepID=UPI002B210E78|nr:HIRAN domain-containing protein [Arcicella sp. LKC2W]MEA5459141.1 HIRAN domain-containing protein [Arcicella sp. LKC2W]
MFEFIGLLSIIVVVLYFIKRNDNKFIQQSKKVEIPYIIDNKIEISPEMWEKLNDSYFEDNSIDDILNVNDDLIINCAGFQYNEASLVKKFKKGSIVELIPDPNNKADKNAIKIYYEGFLIGFVPREYCNEVYEILLGEYSASIYHYDGRRKDFFKLQIIINKVKE